MANFVIQFPLITEKFQEDVLGKRFDISRKIYNAALGIILKRFREMTKTKRWRTKDKEIQEDVRKALMKEFRIGKTAFEEDVKKIRYTFEKNIDSDVGQKIALRLWEAFEKVIFGDGKQVHFKKYGTLNSLEGKSNKSGIRLRGDRLLWFGLEIPVKIDRDNPYIDEAFQSKICFCRIIRKFIKNKYKYYLQIVFEGIPPVKRDSQTGRVKHPLGKGDVGIDIGTQTVAISSKTNVRLLELADRVQKCEDIKRRILRKMDRSKRSMNPDNFNSDGTIKKQGSKKVVWVFSKRYLKLKNELKEIFRKQADIRKYQHEVLANQIISLGDQIYAEKMSFKGLQKRSQKTEKNKKGKFKRKKRFGKSLANKAPAKFIEILKRKLKAKGTELIEIDTWKAKASQFNHEDQSYQKKKLSKRWMIIDGKRVQRDMYSAFLIMNVNEDLASFNIDKCNTRFEQFYQLHQMEVERLTGKRNLSSMAI